MSVRNSLNPAPRFDGVFEQAASSMEKGERAFSLPRKLARRGGKRGRPPNNIKPKFTQEQMETAIQVAMYSKSVYNWVASEAEFMGVDLNTPAGREFFKKNAREAAERLLR